MFVYHFTFDLALFGYIPKETIFLTGWVIFQKCIAGSFIFLSGLSCYFAHSSGIKWNKVKSRILVLGASAVGISVVTYIIFASSWIRFGIIHCILFCYLLGLIFICLPRVYVFVLTLIIGLIAFLPEKFGGLIKPVDAPIYMNWIVETNHHISSVDYVPVIPWMFFFLIGLILARNNYFLSIVSYEAEWIYPDTIFRKMVYFFGNHSLLIYLLHQPIFFAGFYLYIKIT